MTSFASDNYAGVPDEVLEALAAANAGDAVSYGDDEWTARADDAFRAHFGAEAQPWYVTTGTAANVLALKAVCRPWEAVITPATSHLNVDECGAPEHLGGLKLLTVATPDGKLTPGDVVPLLGRLGDQHAAQPRVVSVAQSTELGTVYSVDELRALADVAHERGLLLHVDGARLANAAAGLGVDLRAVSTDAGADLLSFGGTKAGLMGAEAVVFLRPGLGEGFEYLRKQHAQLVSKMRFLAAQLEALLGTDLWRRSAEHANAMARRLAAGVADVEDVRLTQPVQANAVFAILPPEATEQLQREHRFYVWDEATGEVRWMCSWDTRPEDVDAFAADVRAVASVPPAQPS
jgi:threonine aldolase